MFSGWFLHANIRSKKFLAGDKYRVFDFTDSPKYKKSNYGYILHAIIRKKISTKMVRDGSLEGPCLSL
jgi:hypothetical protein